MQLAYNKKHNITPKTIQKAIQEMIVVSTKSKEEVYSLIQQKGYEYLPKKGKEQMIKDLNKQMKEAADNLDFELAIMLRDKVKEFNKKG